MERSTLRAGVLSCVLLALLSAAPRASGGSLKEAYDLAGPGGGYDKYVVLETGVTYTGGLWIGGTFNRITAVFEESEQSVRIVGHGAVIDLQGQEICIAYSSGRLDIDDCVILHGDVRFRGYTDSSTSLRPEGSVRYCTFYRPHDYGVRLYGCGDGILIERNILVDTVDTGPDFQYLTGIAMDQLPTGANICLSLVGRRDVYHNWSYHSDPAVNANPLRHFLQLCDYG